MAKRAGPTMLRRGVVCALALGTVLCAAAAGQEAPAIAPGAHVRLSGPAMALQEGSLRSVHGDTIFLDVRQFLSPFAIPVGRVSRIEVLVGRHRHTKVGANVGGITGLVVGIGASARIFRDGCRPQPGGDALDTAITAAGCGMAVLLAPAYFMIIGYGLGALVGHFVVTETWAGVPPDRIRMALVPRSGGGLGIGVSLAF